MLDQYPDLQGFTFEDALSYLGESGMRQYVIHMAKGQRRGQAFFNALDPTDRDRLSGTEFDPFQLDDKASIVVALIFLLSD